MSLTALGLAALCATEVPASADTADPNAAPKIVAPLAPGADVHSTAGRTAVPCATDTGVVRRCAGRILDAGGRVLAQGRQEVTGDARRFTVTLYRTEAGRSALRRRPTGVPASLVLAVLMSDGRTSTTRVQTTFVAPDKIVLQVKRTGELDDAVRAQLGSLARTFRAARAVDCASHTGKERGVRPAEAQKLTEREADAACAAVLQIVPGLPVRSTGYGFSRPRRSNATRAGRLANQRLVITFTM